MTDEAKERVAGAGRLVPQDEGTGRPAVPVFSTGQLFGSAIEIHIVHEQETYRLRITRQGKLVLNK
jgi:hemin uptake protein HemP